MKRASSRARVALLAFTLAAAGSVLAGCGSETDDDAGSAGASARSGSGSGGKAASGGAAGKGGTANNAGSSGATASGGALSSGGNAGTTTTGGTNAAGGSANAAGTNAAGGSANAAGTNAAGGSANAAGTNAAGGSANAAGTNAAGGSANAAGTNAAGGSANAAGTNAGGTNAAGGSANAGSGGDGGSATAGTGGNAGTGGSAGSTSGAAGTGGSGTPGVRIVGRTVAGTMGQRFSWPGTSFRARFSGTQISVQLTDGNNKNEFAVVIDGTVTKLTTVNGTSTYPLASNLSNTTHDVLVWRRNESYYNPSEFIGFSNFSSGGALLAPAAAPDRRIELIGDSISVGYGIEGTDPCSATQQNQNNYVAFGSVAARLLNADLITIAWSGIGMYRNYDQAGPSADAMPARYDKILPTDSGAPNWDFAKYTPQAVVINLSTNDYSTRGDPGQPYIDAYVNFLRHVREKYPNAYIFCLIQWSTSGPNINTAMNTLKNAGDTKIEAFDINVTAGGDGCDGHPNVARSQAMGEKLAARLRTVLSWN